MIEVRAEKNRLAGARRISTREPANDVPGATRPARPTGRSLDSLKESAGVTYRLDAPARELRRDIGGGHPLVARATAAAIQGIACQKFHVAADGGFSDDFAGKP